MLAVAKFWVFVCVVKMAPFLHGVIALLKPVIYAVQNSV